MAPARPQRKSRGSILKRCAVGVLKRLPFPAPTPLMDLFLHFRVGNAPAAAPQVDYVAEGGSEAQRMPLSDLPKQADGMLRVVVISDTHERHRQLTLPAGDLLLHCGDILMSSSLGTQGRGERVLRDFNEWLESAPCKERVVVGGNHDAALERLGGAARQLLPAATLLQDSSEQLRSAGLRVYGHGHSTGHSHNRAWQTGQPEVSDACDGADIVLTHGCSPELQAAVLTRAQPVLWASGHNHERHGARREGGLLFVNAAIHDARYRPVQPPVVVDLPPRRK